MYRTTTRNISVEVEPFYLEERSDPTEDRYFWAYRITIANQSDRFVKLVSRHWRITDAAGKVELVDGPGVVGEQPELDPGDSFQYTSGCQLTTSSGIMAGRYTMVDGQGATFDVQIPAFSLDLPAGSRTLN